MPTITEERAVGSFDEVVLRGYGDLVVEQTAEPDAAARLVIEADDFIMPKLSSDVRGRRLILGFSMAWYEWVTWWFSWAFLSNKGIHYRLSAPRIQELAISGSGSVRCEALRTDSCRLRISGSGRINVEGLKAGSMEAHISGSGDTHCAGSADTMRAEISGSGSVEAQQLSSRTARVGISGSGGAAVNASDTLDVHITGSGGVRYNGSPKISSRITGSGRLMHLGA